MKKNNKFIKKILHNENLILYRFIVVLILYMALSVMMLFQNYNVDIKIQLNDVVTKDIIAEDDLKYIDEEASARNEEIIRMTTPPYFSYDQKYTSKRIGDLKQLVNDIRDKLPFEKAGETAEKNDITFSKNDFKLFIYLLNEEPKEINRLLAIVSDYYERGVIKPDAALIARTEISGVRIMRSYDNKMSDILYSVDELSEFEPDQAGIRTVVSEEFRYLNDFDRKLLANFVINFLLPNILYDAERTETNLKNKLKNERNVYRKIIKGQIVARRGDIVTPDNLSKIKAILYEKQNHLSYKTVASYLIINFLLLIFFYFFVRLYEPAFFSDIKNLVFISVIFLLFAFYTTLPFNFDRTNYYFGVMIPIATFSITFMFLYSRIVSVFLTVIFALTFYFLSGYNSSSFLFIILSGIASLLTIKSHVRRRIDLLVAGIYVALFNVVIAFSLSLYDGLDRYEILNFSIYAAVNGIVSAVFAIGLISLGEFTLNTPTIFRLQELSDTSSPLIKELFDNAVGTYTHSINVANLAEAAANEITANGLLAKVGGLYHDIGKVGNAEYFIENQGEYNIHSELKPSISATIIKSHVKRGVDKAAAAGLPRKVIDIIYQHHGNSFIKFFYNEALKQRLSPDEEVPTELYQYKAENPQFPEAAIVMLADQVEATSRVVAKATRENFEKLVNTIVDEKFNEGILDDSGLTLKDLTKIKKIFIKTLVGMYHSRIEYPGTPLAGQNGSEKK